MFEIESRVAQKGHGSMLVACPLSGEEGKSDFEAAMSVGGPISELATS